MVNLSGYLQSANTVGVINSATVHGAGKHKLQSNVLLKGEAALAKAFKLDEPSKCNQNLVNALKKVIQEAGISPLSADSSAILEEVGKLMQVKQSKGEALEPKQITMLQDMYIVIKLARKLNDKTDNDIGFNLFSDFERGNRFSYSDDGGQINIASNNRTGGKDSTSWTSFIKDTLAYNVTLSNIDGGTQKKSIADIFNSVDQPVTEKSAKELQQRLNTVSNPVTEVRPSLQQPTLPNRSEGDLMSEIEKLNMAFEDKRLKMAEIKPLLNDLEIKQAETLDASNFTDVSDAEFIADLKRQLPKIPSYFFAELGNDFESGFNKMLSSDVTSMVDFIQQVIDCFDKAPYKGILDGSNQDTLVEKINEVLNSAQFNIVKTTLQNKGIDMNYEVQTVAALLSQLKELAPEELSDVMKTIGSQPIEYPEDYDTLTTKNFQALFGVKQDGNQASLEMEFLTTKEHLDVDNAAQELYVSKHSLKEDEFHSKSMKLLARFIKDNRSDELNFTDHPKLSRLFADLPEDKKEQLAIFNKFMNIEEFSENPVNAFDRSQRVNSDFNKKQEVLNGGLGITRSDIEDLMNAYNSLGAKNDKTFDQMQHYIFKKPDPNGDYYFQAPVMKRFAYIIYKLDEYLTKKATENQPGITKAKKGQRNKAYDELVSRLLPEEVVYKGKYSTPVAQVQKLFESISETIKSSTGNVKDNEFRAPFQKAMKDFTRKNISKEDNVFFDVLDNLEKLTKEEDAYFDFYQEFKDHLEFNKSGFFVRLETTSDFPKSFNLESLPVYTEIKVVKAQLETNFKFIETKFREAFVPSFGEIKFEDIMDLFQKNPLATHSQTGQTYAQMTEQVLSLLDEQSQMTFLSDFLYPAITMKIQLNALDNFEDGEALNNVLKEKELKFTRHPATSEQIKKLDSKSLQQLLYLSPNGFDINLGNEAISKRSSSLLNSAQLDALLSIKKAFDNNTTSLIKLDAGEGKTFLSTIASRLCDITSSPIIHVAPFAQDVPDWEPLPMTGGAIDFSKLENGQHYWVKQNDIMQSLDGSVVTQSLKNALIFCDEYDRYPDLNKKLDELGCRKRCNMSATDNIEEVNQKVLEASQKFYILADKATVDPSIKPQLFLLGKMSSNPDFFKTHEFNQTIDEITTKLNGKESFLHKKLTRLKEKVPNLIARRQNKMDHEFETRKMTINKDEGYPAFESMIDGAKGYIGKKIQFIFQGIEFSARESDETAENELPISEIKNRCEGLYQKGQEDQEDQEALPVYLHLCAPKGIPDYNEGHPITLQYNGNSWTVIDFDEFQKEPQEGTQVTLYDTFTKVGGDFVQFSNRVDYQAIQVAPDALSDESSEPLSKSLLYQECRRARDSKCDINLFMSPENKAKVDQMSGGLLPHTAAIEQASNERVLQARANRKKSGAEIKLFNATLDQWLTEVQPKPASFKEALQTALKDYANEHVGQYSDSDPPTDSVLNQKWGYVFQAKYNEIKNKLNKECAIKKIAALNMSDSVTVKTPAWSKEADFDMAAIKERFKEISTDLWQAITTSEDPDRQAFFKKEEQIEGVGFGRKQTKKKYLLSSLSDNINYVLQKEDFRSKYQANISDHQTEFIMGLINEFLNMLKADSNDTTFTRCYQDLSEAPGGDKTPKAFYKDRAKRWDEKFKNKIGNHLSEIEKSLLVTKNAPSIEFKTEGPESYHYDRALRWGAIVKLDDKLTQNGLAHSFIATKGN